MSSYKKGEVAVPCKNCGRFSPHSLCMDCKASEVWVKFEDPTYYTRGAVISNTTPFGRDAAKYNEIPEFTMEERAAIQRVRADKFSTLY